VNAAALSREAIAPDVLDVSFAFGQQAQDATLLQPYFVERWAEIPRLLKDDQGHWAAGYFGVIAFAVNKAVVAQTPLGWTDLLKPIYTGQFAFTGDPRTANQAIQSVYAASLANGGSLDNAAAGLTMIAQLRDVGTLSATMANPALFLQGDTPIISVWSYIAHALRIQAGSNPLVEVVIPKSSVAGAYVQAINAYAPHPFAARLWLEHVFSDEVQMQWANAYAIPSRASALLADQARTGILTALGVTPELLSDVQIPTLTQMTAAKALISEQWDSVVSFDIKEIN
jgi:putative spermidine/putrescine transport system substrate-binding protein